jgi:hypothetical protein
MMALRIQDHQQPGTTADSRRPSRAPQPGQRRRRGVSLAERMSSQYWCIARRERVLCNIGTILRDELVILPVQCSEAVKHLLSLRGAAQEARNFYSSLAPQDMKAIAPWGILVKLQCLEEQATEIILLLGALESISHEPSYNRVQLQLSIRHTYPLMFATFDEATAQLAALVTKAREHQREREARA